jgi:hypothetical protein
VFNLAFQQLGSPDQLASSSNLFSDERFRAAKARKNGPGEEVAGEEVAGEEVAAGPKP